MKGYWQFLVVAVICLLVAWLWALPQRRHAAASRPVAAAVVAPVQQKGVQPSPSKAGATTPATEDTARSARGHDKQPLPGSSSSLPLLAVIGFGVLAGGITSAMRTRAGSSK